MTDRYEALRKAAVAATPGPWEHEHADRFDDRILRLTDRRPVAWVGANINCDPRDSTDAAYIAAASPDVVLALLAERDALVALVESFAEHDCHYGDGCPQDAGTRHGTCTGCQARAALAAWRSR